MNTKASDVYKMLPDAKKILLFNQLQLAKGAGSYSYHSGDYINISDMSMLITSYGVVEAKILQGAVTISDMYIAYAVAMLGVTDVVSISKYLKWLHKQYPEKRIPHQLEMGSLKNRVAALARTGILRVSDIYTSNDKKIANAISISDIGAKVVKRKLSMEKMSYDAWALTDTTAKIYARIITAKILCSIIDNTPADILSINTSVSLYDKNSAAKRGVLGEVIFGNDNRQSIYYIEPVTFQVDKSIKTELENTSDIMDRVNMYASIINEAELENNDINIIFVVDDMESMQKIISQIKTLGKNFAKHCLFTTERLIQANEGRLYRSFYSLKLESNEDGTESTRIPLDIDHPDIFGVEDYKRINLRFKDLCDLGLATICDEENEKLVAG